MTRDEREKKRAELYKKLEVMGIRDFSYYSLVNNYGYTFSYKGVKYDSRHWLNCYGSSCDFWQLDQGNIELDRATALIIKYDREGIL